LLVFYVKYRFVIFSYNRGSWKKSSCWCLLLMNGFWMSRLRKRHCNFLISMWLCNEYMTWLCAETICNCICDALIFLQMESALNRLQNNNDVCTHDNQCKDWGYNLFYWNLRFECFSFFKISKGKKNGSEQLELLLSCVAVTSCKCNDK
jgi:hypothetical protein